jgi:hypothetical protein
MKLRDESRFVPIGRQVQREMEQFFRTRREANHSETPDAPFFIGRIEMKAKALALCDIGGPGAAEALARRYRTDGLP